MKKPLATCHHDQRDCSQHMTPVTLQQCRRSCTFHKGHV